MSAPALIYMRHMQHACKIVRWRRRPMVQSKIDAKYIGKHPNNMNIKSYPNDICNRWKNGVRSCFFFFILHRPINVWGKDFVFCYILHIVQIEYSCVRFSTNDANDFCWFYSSLLFAKDKLQLWFSFFEFNIWNFCIYLLGGKQETRQPSNKEMH